LSLVDTIGKRLGGGYQASYMVSIIIQ